MSLVQSSYAGNSNLELLPQIITGLFMCDSVKTGAAISLLRTSIWKLLHPEVWVRTARRQLLSAAQPIGILAGPKRSNRGASYINGQPTLKEIQGIPNYGQTCFLNSVLQSLASLGPFLAYLERIVKVQSDIDCPTVALSDGDAIKPKDDSFPEQLLSLLEVINGYQATKKRVDPRPLLRQVGESNQQFRPESLGEQQDAQELLQALLGVVIAEGQLDSIDSSSDHMNRLDTQSNQETFTTVLAGAERTEEITPRNKEALAVSPEIPIADNAMSLSGMLERIDETQRLQKAEHHQVTPQVNTSTDSDRESTHNVSLTTEKISTHEGNENVGRLHQREEKKQEDFEIPPQVTDRQQGGVKDSKLINGVTNGDAALPLQGRNSCTLTASHEIDNNTATVSTSMQILSSTLSSITPSPLSGWLGSTLQCCQCNHVRPIQNSPFLDIPLVPTSVPLYLTRAHPSSKRATPGPNASPMPACSLNQCLSDFTSVERVQGVECRFCSIKRELHELQEDSQMLQSAIESTERRNKTKGGEVAQATVHLRNDLVKTETRLRSLQAVDPDEEDECVNASVSTNSYEAALDTLQRPTSRERHDARKCLLLTRCPSILCLHIQRRYYDPFTDRMEKCIQYVEFPEVLDLSPYCAYSPHASASWAAGSLNSHGMPTRKGTRSRIPYRLQSIIEHRGNAHGGHYISYRIDRTTGQWFRISDNNVTPVTWGQVQICQAYMLFYEAM